MAASGSTPSSGEELLWKVVGGAEKGGILVRKGEGLASEAEEMRLSTGAFVRQVALAKERLSFELVSGAGPGRGWVSLRAGGKELVSRCAAGGASRAVTGAVAAAATPAVALRPPHLGRPRMRVLALHGGGSNSNITKFQTIALQKLTGDKAEWDFLDGGRLWKYEVTSEILLALAKGKPLQGWYGVVHDDDSERSWNEKMFDDSVTFTYEEVDIAVDRVLTHFKEKGPFDVLLGFSQGCIISHLVAGVLRDRGQPIPWRLSVQFCGMRVRDNRYLKLFEVPLAVPCVQVYGRKDEYFEYARQSQPSMYENPVILEHDEGHKFPSEKPRATEINDRVVREMLWHCGMAEKAPGP